jgi:hypothetical protein
VNGSFAAQALGGAVQRRDPPFRDFLHLYSRCGARLPEAYRFAADSLLEGDGFEPSVPREGVKGPSPQFHADYPPIGWAHKQRMKRMLNGFKRDGITCPAQTGCQPDRLS